MSNPLMLLKTYNAWRRGELEGSMDELGLHPKAIGEAIDYAISELEQHKRDAEQSMVAMIDAAMAEMSNIHPPLKRSECERLIRSALSAQPDHSADKLKTVKTEPAEIPIVWSKSLSSCWPEDDQYPEMNWIIGTIDEDGNKYPVITVEAYQYDAEGHSEQIAKAISALWKSAAQQAEVKL